MAGPDLSLTEWVVLALVAESPTHGFAVAKQLEPKSDLGRIMTVHRPLVYRALDRLAEAGLVEESGTEPGDAGPNRVVMRATRRGRSALKRWFVTPVDHVRDLRIEFLIKLRLTERIDGDRSALVAAQQAELADTLATLAAGVGQADRADGQTDDRTERDVVDEWRRHNAAAARNFLNDL